MTASHTRRVLKVEPVYSYRSRILDVRSKIRLQGLWLSRVFAPGMRVEVITDCQAGTITLRPLQEDQP